MRGWPFVTSIALVPRPLVRPVQREDNAVMTTRRRKTPKLKRRKEVTAARAVPRQPICKSNSISGPANSPRRESSRRVTSEVKCARNLKLAR